MSDPSPKLFTSDAAIRHIGEGLLAHTLPRAQWTHEAHLAACCWLIRDRTDIDIDHEMPIIISSYNISVGGVNSDTEGYHETITRCFIHAVRLHLRDRDSDESLMAAVNALLKSEMGKRNWPLRFYSRGRLFSREARRNWVKPDIIALPA